MIVRTGVFLIMLMIFIMGCKTDEKAECELNQTGTVAVTNNFDDAYYLEINQVNWGVLEAYGGTMTMDVNEGSYDLKMIQKFDYPSDEDPHTESKTAFVGSCQTVTWAP